MALTDPQIRALDTGPNKTRLAPFIATMEVAGRLGLPGSTYGSGLSTVVPTDTAAGVLDYYYAGGQFETIRHPELNPSGEWDTLKQFLGIAGLGAGAIFAPKEFLPAVIGLAGQTAARALSPTPVANYRAALADIAPVASSPTEVAPMAFFDSFDWAGGLVSDVGDTFGWGNILEAGTSIATAALAPSYSMPQYQNVGYQQPQAYPVAQQSTALATRARSAGLPAWSAKYPSLWQFIATKGLGSGAIGSMLNLLTKWGPAALVGMWGAQVVSDLVNYKVTRKRRRMNPANSKALRRAARRIKGFHRMCGHIDLLKTRGRHRAPSCGTCKRSPCRCR